MEERQSLILGAVLHDIGKFHQRTGIRRRHAEVGAEFLDRSEVSEKISKVADFTDVRKIVLGHHEPGQYDLLVRVVQMADWLSAGERRPLEQEEVGTPRETPLTSIFSQVLTPGQELPERYYPTASLELDQKIIFPRSSVTTDYPSLWEHFISEFPRLPDSTFRAFFESLLFLLQKYTWCVPSAAWRHIPDVSLFNHAKMCAAIAWCLYEERDRIDSIERAISQEPKSGEKIAILVGGDLSGIQSFIYTLSSKGVAKGLRGRSVFLGLLTEAIVELIRRELGDLPLCNVVYNSGGHFYLLAPASQESHVSDLQTHIGKRMFDLFGGQIYCTLSSVPLTVADFQVQRATLGERWAELSRQIAEGKGRRFIELMKSDPSRVFDPHGAGELSMICQVCHKEISQENRLEVAEWREDAPICSLCESFERLGDDLKDARYLVANRATGSAERGALTWWKALEAFGTSFRFVPDSPESSAEGIYILDDTDFLPAHPATCVMGFRFVGRANPLDSKGHLRSFEELAEDSDGVERWGLLRMDVDNLGQIFKEGLGTHTSFSRISTLSSMISLFFEGYLNEICRDLAPNRSYVIYSGGDDSFIVGSWDAIVDLAQTIRKQFAAYVSYNPRITLSAGISIEAKKYPLYKAADRAAGFLDAAKTMADAARGKEKDALTFLGRSFFWEDFEQAVKAKKLICELIGQEISRGFLQKLNEIYVLYTENSARLRAFEFDRDTFLRLAQNDRWRWQLVYNLSKEKPEFKEQLDKLQRMIVEEGIIDYLNVPVRWVELLTRSR